jgi:hypothetical protein
MALISIWFVKPPWNGFVGCGRGFREDYLENYRNHLKRSQRVREPNEVVLAQPMNAEYFSKGREHLKEQNMRMAKRLIMYL